MPLTVDREVVRESWRGLLERQESERRIFSERLGEYMDDTPCDQSAERELVPA